MLDEILIPEIRKTYEEMYDLEKDYSDEEKLHKHQIIKDTADIISELSNIARKEGLLALEEEMEKNNSLSEMTKELIGLIVDGTDPDIVKRFGLMRLFSSKVDVYSYLCDIISIYGMLDIQAGVNPILIYKMLNEIVPLDVKSKEKFYGMWGYIEKLDQEKNETKNDTKENEEVELTIEKFSEGDIRLKPRDTGFFEIKILDETIKSLDNRAMQRVLRDANVGDLKEVLCVTSGEARRNVLTNMSKNNSHDLMVALHNNFDYWKNSDYRMKFIQHSATNLLELINKLNMKAEIVITREAEPHFLSIILEHLSSKEDSDKVRKDKCDMLIDILGGYKRSLNN